MTDLLYCRIIRRISCKLVGRVCNDETWGALIETEETVLKDAISADIKEQYSFNPKDEESLVAFKGGIDGGQALFDFLTQFDSQFAEKQIETGRTVFANYKRTD